MSTLYPNGFPDVSLDNNPFKSIKEANEFYIYEMNVKELKENPIGTYCGHGDGNKCLANEDVLEFIELFTTGQLFVNYASLGEEYDSAEMGEKCVQSLWFHYKEDVQISPQYYQRIINNKNSKEFTQNYQNSSKSKAETLEFLNSWFELLVNEAHGSLVHQGGDVEG